MRTRLYAALFVFALGAVACGGGGEQGSRRPAESPQPARTSTVTVVLKSYSVSVDPESVPAGKVSFKIQVASGSHALSVLRTDIPPDQLPINEHGQAQTLDPRIQIVAADGPNAQDRYLEAELKPGRYVLICNDSADYARGMRTGLTVTS